MAEGTEAALRRRIVDLCREMNRSGLNQGTSGNISARLGSRMLVTPTSTPYETMTAEMIVSMPLEPGDDPPWTGPVPPSVEWRFHRDILLSRPDMNAVVHAHSTFCTAIAMTRRPIPAAHYMVAAFGGSDVRCAGYARYGTAALSRLALEALEGRTACLLANHGMIAMGETLDRAMWRAVELETLARQYHASLALPGGPVILSESEIAETLEGFGSYGRRSDE